MVSTRVNEMRRLALAGVFIAGCTQIVGIKDLVSDERPDGGVVPPAGDAGADVFDAGEISESGPPDDGAIDANVPFKRVFVTSNKFPGNIGSLTIATSHCNDAATNGLLGGDWVAFLADGTTKAIDQVTDVPYKTLDGRLVTRNKMQLSSGTLINAIDVNESGAKVTGGNESEFRVWTGTPANGNPQSTCINWTSNQFVDFGTEGWCNRVDRKWLDTDGIAMNGGGYACNTSGRLYCFEK